MADPRSLIDTYAVYIDGRWFEPDNGRYDDINPATETVIASAPDSSYAQVESAIAAARTAFDAGPWADAGPEQRAASLNQLGEALLAHADDFFALAQQEWGCTQNERVIHVEGPVFAALNAAELATHPVEEQIVDILRTRIAPAVGRDGGSITLVGYRDGVATVEMRGACGGCPSALMTLKRSVETTLKRYVPELDRVEAEQEAKPHKPFWKAMLEARGARFRA